MDNRPETTVPNPITRMPEYYERQLNPDSSLPFVSIEKLPVKTAGTLIPTPFLIKDENGLQIGSFILNISKPPNNKPSAYLNTIQLDESFRGKGLGRSTYLEILKYLGDIKLHSGFQLSRGALSIWEWLVARGVAKKTSEGVINENTVNAGYSSAEYEVI